jgi:hypothetical protein
MDEIKISYKKLGKERAHGLAYKDEREIIIDPRLKGCDMLETLIHEIMHIQNPRWPEIKVQGHSKQMAKMLYQQGYRKVDI